MLHSSFFLLLALFSIAALSQHTTSPRFTPQPTSSGVFCIQMVCPSPGSSQAACPSDCSSGCKLVPDQCCPQLTMAVCQDDNSSTSTVSPSASSTLGTTTGTLPSSSQVTSSPSPNSNFGVVLQPSLSCHLVLVVLMLYHFS